MRGRKPKPTALRVIEGVPGHRALNTDEPVHGPLGFPPADLDGIALAKWEEMAGIWGVVATAADRDQFAEYCRLEARRVEAEAMIVVEGPIAKTAGGYKVQGPWMQILNKCREDMRKIAIEFGGTPASRTRVKATRPEPASKFDGLLKRG